MTLRGSLSATPFALSLAWGCSVNDADLGSNVAGRGADSSHAGQDASHGSSATGAVGGSAGPDGGTAGRGTSGGRDSGGSAGNAATDGGSDGEPGGNAGDAGSGGTSQCACPYPPILGGDCCTVRDACETDGVTCDELRSSVQTLRTFGVDEDNYGEPAADCLQAISHALVERCAFVPPMCGEPAEGNATFGERGERGYTECTTEETRAGLQCGELGSYYGPTCCQRKRCHEDGVCPSGRCIYALTQIPNEFLGGYPDATECRLEPEGCTCGWIDVFATNTAYCIGDDEDIARFDCDAPRLTCAELASWHGALVGALESATEPSTEATSAYEACADKISLELEARCPASAD